jgi:predicted CXXCH cytochrome family protein
MKRSLLVMSFAVAVALLAVGVAFADGGPHGGFTPITDACAGCHRAHTAVGPNLLINNSTFGLCASCHGAAGLGANTNVDDGFYLESRDDSAGDGDHGAANTPDNAPLLGGGFVNYRGLAVTSVHDTSGTVTAAWGFGVNRGITADLAEGLDCASCHDPHGSPNYRIINAVINGVSVAVAQVDEAAKDYDTEQWQTGTSDLCAACHGAYHQTAPGQASILDGGSYTHRIDMAYNFGGNVNPETVGLGGYTLPLAESNTNNRVVCMTCHLPHGTSAQMTGIADGGPDGTGTLPGDTTATDSALLRLDDRGVCQVCHHK